VAALILDPGLAEAHYNLACFHSVRGEHALAVEDFSRALALNPALTRAYDLRADSLLALSRTAEAQKDLAQAAALRADLDWQLFVSQPEKRRP
jgi:tetratricopeptide (TPR) repeat protein